MGKKCPPCDCKQGLPLWLGTFGDLMSLLLTFFVLLLSMATFDAKKLSEAEGSMRGTLGMLDGGTKTESSKERMQMAAPMDPQFESAEEVRRIRSILIELNEMTKVSRGPSAILEDGDEGFLVRLPARLLFSPGSTVIENEDTLLFLKRFTEIVKSMPTEVMVKVRGHTDNREPGTESLYSDNWEVSSYRALAVSKELVMNGVSPERINACGESSYKPLVSNATREGRLQNNRVDIYLHSKKLPEEERGRSILDNLEST